MDPNASPTVRIKYPANLRVGYCQIPASEYDPDVHAIWVDDDAGGIGTDSGDQLSDDQLRAAIETATGVAPHHRTGREKLIAQFNELNAQEAA